MGQYDKMLALASTLNLQVYEMNFRSSAKGLIKGNRIAIRKELPSIEKACVLSEEIGHDQTGVGNILSQTTPLQRKQELRAREWAYRCLIPLEKIIEAHKVRISGRYELAEHLNVTEDFLQNAINRYTAKYGVILRFDEKYTICFEPLGVIEEFS